MERAKVFIFVGLGLIAALVIYGAAATKRAANDDHQNRLARIEALMNEGEVKYHPSFFHAHRAVTREKIAGLEPAKTVTEIAPPKAPVKDTKAEDAKKAAEKKAADEKKKKEEDVKKKKKKKKAGDKTTDAQGADSEQPKQDDKKKDETADAGGLNGGLSALPYAPLNGQDPNKLPETVEEWIAYLFANPSFEKTSKFIQLAQVGTVKSDVFYPVVEKMLTAEGRLPEFGIMAIGSLPNSQSFQLLADLGNEPTLEDKLKSQTQQYMTLYTRIEYIRFLAAVAMGTDTVAANDAITLIQRSLTNLNGLSSSTPSTSSTRLPASNITKIYEQVVASLTTVAQTSTDGAVSTNASQTASQISQRLAALGSTANAS